ncbi:MAG: NlpC/P60 family protein [Rhizobiaceae bacterium]
MTLNPRLNAFRPDIADSRLRGKIDAERFVEGKPARVAVPVANVRRKPDSHAGLDTQLLLGDDVFVFEMREGWAWVQSARDGYVGYINVGSLTDRHDTPTHIVTAPRTFVYSGADLRFPQVEALSMGCAVTVVGDTETRGTRYALLANGEALIEKHLRPIGEHSDDFVSVAETFPNTPYLWGGTSGFGIDCSGLVQLSMRMCGLDVLRDTDMQEHSIGAPLDAGVNFSNVRRGDLVFWKGHVAIMTDGENMIHANGHTMLVSHEQLDDAIERIGYLYGQPTSFRRV